MAAHSPFLELGSLTSDGQAPTALLYPTKRRPGVRSYEWIASENHRKAKFYRLTAAGKRQLVQETNRWRQMARAIALVMGEKVLAQEGDL